MKDYRQTPHPTRNGITGVVVIGVLAVIVVVGPHLLRGSPITNESTDPANGVPTAAVSMPRCDTGRAPAWMTLHGYLRLAAASVCVTSYQGGRRSIRRESVPLTPAQLRRLEADFNAHSTGSPRIQRTCDTDGPSTVLSGVTVDGHTVRLSADGCTGEFAGAGRYWVPDAATRATIRSVLDR